MIPGPPGNTFAHPDVYFDLAYCEAAAHADNAEPVTLGESDRWEMPIAVRTLASGRKDAASPYGYSGVHDAAGAGVSPSATWTSILQKLHDLRVISLFVRASPLVRQIPPPPHAIRIVQAHPTYLVSTKDSDAAWSTMEGRSRTAVRKARKQGLVSEIRNPQDNDLCHRSAFRQLYNATMADLSASKFYNFDDGYYDLLAKGLGSRLLLATVVSTGGTTLAAGLFLQGPRYLHYHLSAATAEGRRLGATNLMIWDAIDYAHMVRLDGLYLGGGLSRGDPLDRFKRSFGGQTLPFNAYGVVVDSEAYEAELRDKLARHPERGTSGMAAKYFPAYRDPQFGSAPHD